MRGYLNGEPILARPVTQFECAVKWARRRPAMTAVLGLVASVTVLGLGGVLWQWRHAIQSKRQALPAQGVGGRTVWRSACRRTDCRPLEPAHRWVSPFGRVVLARVGPTTPTRARRLADASVDPTEAGEASR